MRHSLKGIGCAVILIASCAATHGRELAFAEPVYYAHQVGATEPLEEAFLRQLMERTVPRYLKQSVALGTFGTLEDAYGTTGNKFAGAIGFQVFESQGVADAVTGYGVGVDDVLIEWREFTLEEDQTDCDTVCVGGTNAGDPCSSDAQCAGAGASCGGGSCATINMTTVNIFEGNTTVGITVVDFSPSPNDCNHDGDRDDGGDDFDCDDNSVPDVVIKVIAQLTEDAGEFFILNAVPGSASTFTGQIPISSSYNVPGSVFIASQGATAPTIRATYNDIDDGTGRPCQNSVDPNQWAEVQVTNTIFIANAQLVVTRSTLSDNGDDDGWADTGETVDLAIEVSNKSGADLTDVKLRMTTNDANIACITKPVIILGDLKKDETRFSIDRFQFVVSPDAKRTDVFEELTATLNISIDANEFQSLAIPQEITIDLDLDATGGGAPTTFFETFEGGFGSFTTMHIDEDLNPPDSDLTNHWAGVLNADGFRCQYSDPEWHNGVVYATPAGEDCYPNANNQPDQYWFHIVTDRGFTGSQSMHFGLFLDQAKGYTTPVQQLEAVRTTNPINLGWDKVCSLSRTTTCSSAGDCPTGETCDFAQPVVKVKHQISLLDHRNVGIAAPRAADRGIMSVQVADNDGNPAGVWIKAQPYVNVYDGQANSNFFNCTFDPTDDGNDEGDFFDPTDPNRFFGPSSTCAPGFMFVYQGDTDAAFDATALGQASDGPGLQGASGIGTWVEPVIDIARFRGRRVRIRFLMSGIKLGNTVTWDQFVQNPNPGDDGWFIDDVTVIDAIQDPPATVTVDTDTLILPTCGDLSCRTTGVVTDVALTPATGVTSAPGQVVELDASGSTVDVCLSGVLQYKFWIEVNGNDTFEPSVDGLLRDWTDNDTLRDTPQGPTDYAVSVRCATDTGCLTTQIVPVDVNCPSSGNIASVDSTTPFLHRVPATRRSIVLDASMGVGDKDVSVYWSSGVTVDAVRGDLATLRSFGFGGEVCISDNQTGSPTTFVDTGAPVPNSGDGVWYLMRSAAACNEPGAGGSYGGLGEDSTPNRDTISACPN